MRVRVEYGRMIAVAHELLLVVAIGWSSIASAQTPPRDPQVVAKEGSATLRGRVVGADTGAPLRETPVSIAAVHGGFQQATFTDSNGQFEFATLVADEYRIRVLIGAGSARYLPLSDSLESALPLVRVSENQVLDGIEIRLKPAAAISGRVVDEYGEPLAFTTIRVLQRLAGGRHRPAGGQTLPVQTDDHGRFRVFGLSPGTYVLSADPTSIRTTVSAARATRLLPTYFPGTANITEAAVIDLTYGQEAAGLEVRLARGGVFAVRGVVVDSRGMPSPDTIVMLMSRPPGGGVHRRDAHMEPDGSFVLREVLTGEYLLGVRPKLTAGIQGLRSEFAKIPLTVNQDLSGIVVATKPAPSISGRVVVEGAAASGGVPAGMRVTAVERDSTVSVGLFPATTAVDKDGNFTLRNVPDRVLLRVDRAAGWWLNSVTVAGEDVTDRPTDFRDREQRVQIVLTKQGASIDGRVAAAAPAHPAKAAVVLFSADRELWSSNASTTRVPTVSADGSFTIPALRAGAYLIVAVPGNELALHDATPDYFEMLAGLATPFTVAENESKSIALSISQLPQ